MSPKGGIYSTLITLLHTQSRVNLSFSLEMSKVIDLTAEEDVILIDDTPAVPKISSSFEWTTQAAGPELLSHIQSQVFGKQIQCPKCQHPNAIPAFKNPLSKKDGKLPRQLFRFTCGSCALRACLACGKDCFEEKKISNEDLVVMDSSALYASCKKSRFVLFSLVIDALNSMDESDQSLENVLTSATLCFPKGYIHLYSLLENSLLYRRIYELLHNDSFDDIIARSSLFRALFEFLTKLSTDGNAVRLMSKHPADPEEKPQVPVARPRKKSKKAVDPPKLVESPTCMALFVSLVKQANLYRNMCRQEVVELVNTKADSEHVEQVIMAKLISDTNSALLNALSFVPILLDDAEAPLNYVDKLQPLCFSQASFADTHAFTRTIFPSHSSLHPSYSGHSSKNSASTSLNHNRLGRIAKEIATLSTSLRVSENTSIFVAADETRIDILKAVITGPVGTPYANGILEFDIFIPPDYPLVPPLVHFLTNKGGRYRMNPNLYETGKVCISLLGNTGGSREEKWCPGQSTLLQVLLSIQSQILVEYPYFNYSNLGDPVPSDPNSVSFNHSTREHVLEICVLEMLRNPPPLWKEVILLHFKLKKNEILKQLTDWTKLTPRLKGYATSIRAELKKL